MAAPAAATKATISITETSPDPNNNLYTVTFQSHSILTTLTSNPTTLSTWISSLPTTTPLIVGLDIEWRPNFHTNSDNPAATLQLCVGSTCLIFQLIHSPHPLPKILYDFLSNEQYTFVGVGIESDVEKLMYDYELVVSKRVDLADLAAQKGAARRGCGLKELTRQVLGVEVGKPKKVTMSRWDSEWLSYQQIQYACVDAFLSFEIGRRLMMIDIGTAEASNSGQLDPKNVGGSV